MKFLLLASGVLAMGCGDNLSPAFPAPQDLPVQFAPPDPFTMFDGRSITSADEWWSSRRPELGQLFRHYMYGYEPADPGNTTVTELTRATIDGSIDYREYEVHYGPPDTPPIYLAVFAPLAATHPVPVFLGLNPCGNQTLTADPAVRVSTAWIENACDPSRGSLSSKWPLDLIIARGAALATFHQSDVDPDDIADRLFSDGIHPHFSVESSPETRWGTIAAWTFGMSRAIDALGTLEHIDATRIATVGHSRRGKVALLTAAFDPRVALAIPHQSGTAGATLTRSDLGESVASINLIYPHWFNDVFPLFGDDEARLPVDQHLLIGMVAPRPVLVTNGADDTWADPPGALAAVEAAQPIYELLGARGIVRTTSGDFDLAGDLVWHIRDGGHAQERRDWVTFLDFAELHW